MLVSFPQGYSKLDPFETSYTGIGWSPGSVHHRRPSFLLPEQLVRLGFRLHG